MKEVVQEVVEITMKNGKKAIFKQVTQEEHDKMRCKAYKYVTP